MCSDLKVYGRLKDSTGKTLYKTSIFLYLTTYIRVISISLF